MADQTSSFRATRRRACASSRSPAGASTSRRPTRSNSRQPSVSSSRLSCWLAAACETPSALAAAVTPPSSMTARKARTRPMSRSRYIMFSERSYHEYSFSLSEGIHQTCRMIPSDLWLPLITPFKDGAVDFASYERLIEYYLATGVDGLFPLGTTGESPALDEAEIEQLVERTVARVDGRVPVFVGVGGNATHKVEKALRRLERLPFPGIVSVCPYYNRPSQDG